MKIDKTSREKFKAALAGLQSKYDQMFTHLGTILKKKMIRGIKMHYVTHFHITSKLEQWNIRGLELNSGNYLFTTDTK